MAEDFEIDVQSHAESQAGNLQLPLNFLTVGEIEHDDVKVYIKQDTYKKLEKLALSDTAKELGSIILGDYTEDAGKMHVVISEYIEAKYTDASASTLTFTHETWDYVHSEHDKLFPSLKILGWQHTHPDYGVFLSNYDIFIHENFFNMPFQVAYVIDPIQHTRGFFQWKNGKVQKLTGFYIYDDIGRPIKIEQTKPANKEPNNTGKAFSKLAVALLCLLVVISVAFAATFISFNNKLKNQQSEQNELLSQIDQQDEKISTQAESLKELQQALTGDITNSANVSDIQDLIDKLKNKQIVLDDSTELINELNNVITSLKSGGGNSEVFFKAYIVKSGDTLYEICKENGIDYSSNSGIIKALNGIEDLNSIGVGQTVLLPLIKK